MSSKGKVAVVVSSDRAASGTYTDMSGPAAASWLETSGYQVLGVEIVPDDASALTSALNRGLDRGAELVLISGGTGLGPRDVTPQTLDKVCDYEIAGVGEMLRRESLKYTPNAYLSRCGGWVHGRVLVLGLPGNPKAVTEQLTILTDFLPHALKALRGDCDHRPTGDAAK